MLLCWETKTNYLECVSVELMQYGKLEKWKVELMQYGKFENGKWCLRSMETVENDIESIVIICCFSLRELL